MLSAELGQPRVQELGSPHGTVRIRLHMKKSHLTLAICLDLNDVRVFLQDEAKVVREFYGSFDKHEWYVADYSHHPFPLRH